MLDFTIGFSELVQNASLYFARGLDNEKRLITTQVFSEPVFKDRAVVKYSAKEGFGALLNLKKATGSLGGHSSELENCSNS